MIEVVGVDFERETDSFDSSSSHHRPHVLSDKSMICIMTHLTFIVTYVKIRNCPIIFTATQGSPRGF